MDETITSKVRAAVSVAAVAATCLAIMAVADAGAHQAPRCLVPATGKTIDQAWRPDMAAAIAYAHSRVGDIAFAVRTPDRFYG
jgi:hypothetical protein